MTADNGMDPSEPLVPSPWDGAPSWANAMTQTRTGKKFWVQIYVDQNTGRLLVTRCLPAVVVDAQSGCGVNNS
jgi:hypothetical protein